MIGSVTFDGARRGADLDRHLARPGQLLPRRSGCRRSRAFELTFLLGLMRGDPARLRLLPARACSGPEASAAASAPSSSRARSSHSLVPIAFAYVMAHYFTYLLFRGQAIVFLASDPLGDGSDLFGTAGERRSTTA